jgi:hypothetical protein
LRWGKPLEKGHDYEIRFMNAAGALSFLFVTNCASDDQARDAATKMSRNEFATYEIWRDNVCIGAGECVPTAANDDS